MPFFRSLLYSFNILINEQISFYKLVIQNGQFQKFMLSQKLHHLSIVSSCEHFELNFFIRSQKLVNHRVQRSYSTKQMILEPRSQRRNAQFILIQQRLFFHQQQVLEFNPTESIFFHHLIFIYVQNMIRSSFNINKFKMKIIILGSLSLH